MRASRLSLAHLSSPRALYTKGYIYMWRRALVVVVVVVVAGISLSPEVTAIGTCESGSGRRRECRSLCHEGAIDSKQAHTDRSLFRRAKSADKDDKKKNIS